MLFIRNSHKVMVNAEHIVVSITENAVIVPLCPKFFAITKQLLVVALPSITRIATSFSPRNPSEIAAGRNTAHNSTSFIRHIPTVTFTRLPASLVRNDAPNAISERGVAIFPRYDTVFTIIAG